jgi:hypothetical protein
MRVVPLNRKINPRYRVFIFILNFWIYLVYKVLSSFIKSNLLHARFACAQTYLDWRTLVKKSAKILICFFFGLQEMEFLTHEELYSKELFIPLPHFWSTIPQRKKCKHMQKPWSEHAKNHDPNMQKVVCYEAAQNFVYQIYSRVINKNEKPIARVDFPIQRHHSHADPILPDCTFMWSVR